jgi:hypothetical protein
MMVTERLWEAALAGSQWLVAQQQSDGGWAGLDDPKVDGFYKASWSLVVTGQMAAAQRSLNYASEHFLTTDGDFGPRHGLYHNQVHYPYSNTYFVTGSMIAGRYEIAAPAIRFLLSQQSPDHGGCYSRRTEPGGKGRSDTVSSSAVGVAFLAAGQTDAARRVAEFLAHVVELQPAPKDRFFTSIEANRQLGTEIVDDDEAWWRVVDTRAQNQMWYAVGLPFAFLIQLAEATGEAKHWELAQWFFDFQSRCVDPWDGPSSGKAGWGCAIAYRITGERRYRDVAVHVANNIVSKQMAEGNWAWSSLGREGLGPNAGFDLTSEYCLWPALISANIAARDGA